MAATYSNYKLDNHYNPFIGDQTQSLGHHGNEGLNLYKGHPFNKQGFIETNPRYVDLLWDTPTSPPALQTVSSEVSSLGSSSTTTPSSQKGSRTPTWEELQQQHDDEYARQEARRILETEGGKNTEGRSVTDLVAWTGSASGPPATLTDDQQEYAKKEALRIILAEQAANRPSQHETKGYSATGVHPKRKKMKKQRKRRTAGGAVGGAIVGGVVLGPPGAIVGGMAGAAITNKACKAGEKAAQRRFEQQQFQKAANASGIHRGAAFA